jgi:hypothetical protein
MADFTRLDLENPEQKAARPDLRRDSLLPAILLLVASLKARMITGMMLALSLSRHGAASRQYGRYAPLKHAAAAACRSIHNVQIRCRNPRIGGTVPPRENHNA